MGVDDIPYTGTTANIPSSRVTLQYFNVEDPCVLSVVPNNSDARLPQDISNWPPPLILDFFYACAAVNAWSSDGFKNFVKQSTSDYYDNAEVKFSGVNREGEDQQEEDVSQRMPKHRTSKRGSKRKRGSDDKCKGNSLIEAMDIVNRLWTQTRKRQLEQGVVHVPSANHSSQERVERWVAFL
jgi:hypothetical protein